MRLLYNIFNTHRERQRPPFNHKNQIKRDIRRENQLHNNDEIMVKFTKIYFDEAD